MLSTTKMILNGMPVRYFREGTMSDIYIELTEWLEDLQHKCNKYGDFKVLSVENLSQNEIRQEFMEFMSELSLYFPNALKFYDEQIEKNPEITLSTILDLLHKKFF